MGDCDGCPDYQRRIEVYSNSNIGCPADEFVVPIIEPVDPEPTEPEDNDPEETEDTPTPTPTPGEDDSSIYITGTKAILSTLAVLMVEY